MIFFCAFAIGCCGGLTTAIAGALTVPKYDATASNHRSVNANNTFCRESKYVGRVTCYGGLDNVDAKTCAGSLTISLHLVAVVDGDTLMAPKTLSSGNRVSYFQMVGSRVRTIHYDFFANETAVITLNLANNRIEYLDVRMFGRFKNLTYVDLSFNPFKRFSGTVKLFDFEALRTSMRYVNLMHTEITLPGGMTLRDFGSVSTTTLALCVSNVVESKNSTRSALLIDYIKNTCVCKVSPCVPIEFNDDACTEQFQHVVQYKIPKRRNPETSRAWCDNPFSTAFTLQQSATVVVAAATTTTKTTQTPTRITTSTSAAPVPSAKNYKNPGVESLKYIRLPDVQRDLPQFNESATLLSNVDSKPVQLSKRQDFATAEEPGYTVDRQRSQPDNRDEYKVEPFVPVKFNKHETFYRYTSETTTPLSAPVTIEPNRMLSSFTIQDVIIVTAAAALAFAILSSVYFVLSYRFRTASLQKRRHLLSQSKSYELPKYQKHYSSKPSLSRATPNQLRLLETN